MTNSDCVLDHIPVDKILGSIVVLVSNLLVFFSTTRWSFFLKNADVYFMKTVDVYINVDDKQ